MNELQDRIIRAIVLGFEEAAAANPDDVNDETRCFAVTLKITVAEARELKHHVRVIVPAGYALAKKVWDETEPMRMRKKGAK